MADAKQKTGAKPSRRVLDPKKQKKRPNDNGEPTKEEYAVAKFVRFKCPSKKAQLGHGMGGDQVAYFVGSKAVDCLMESKWCKTKKDQALFTDRQAAVDYMQQLLMRGLFYRVKKLVPKIKEKTSTEASEKKKGDQAKTKDELPKSPKPAAKETEVKRRKKDKGDKAEDEEEKQKDEGETEKEKSDEKSPKARKVRLDWHNEQLFIDGSSIYAWKYDPTPLKTWILGFLIVLGAIGLCLFPLWPTQIRIGVYYFSSGTLILLAGFFGFVILRTVLFGAIWAFTLGRHHFWLFPNLTEDCSVYESFRPVYSYKYVPPGSKPTEEKDKKKKDKKSDSEDEGQDQKEIKDDHEEDRASETGSDNEDEQGKDGEDSASQGGDFDGSSNNSARTSTDEEPQTSEKKSPKKRRARRDDGQESSVNGDFEIVDSPKHD